MILTKFHECYSEGDQVEACTEVKVDDLIPLEEIRIDKHLLID